MKKIDSLLLTVVLGLTLMGLFMVYDVSSFVAFRDFSDKYHYIKDQSVWVLLGVIGLFIFYVFDYKKLYNLSLPILFIAIILLTLVFIPGIGVKLLGAHRWIDARVFLVQPAEFVKLALAIYLAAWFSNKEKGRFMAFLLLVGLVILLVVLEPDIGTATVIVGEALAIYFLSGGSVLYFIFLMPLIAAIGLFLINLSPYRKERLETFLNLNQPLEASSYHIKQILIALGSGGLLGVGLGNSIQKYAYLPEVTTDSIFAIIAEELGFVGSLMLIVLFVIVIWRGFYIAAKARDNFAKLLSAGITTFLAIQTIINLAAVTALLPLTGIPLPFISYGGSSLIVDLCSIGILLNIYKQST